MRRAPVIRDVELNRFAVVFCVSPSGERICIENHREPSSVRLICEQVQLVGDIGLFFGVFVGLERTRDLYFLEH